MDCKGTENGEDPVPDPGLEDTWRLSQPQEEIRKDAKKVIRKMTKKKRTLKRKDSSSSSSEDYQELCRDLKQRRLSKRVPRAAYRLECENAVADETVVEVLGNSGISYTDLMNQDGRIADSDSDFEPENPEVSKVRSKVSKSTSEKGPSNSKGSSMPRRAQVGPNISRRLKSSTYPKAISRPNLAKKPQRCGGFKSTFMALGGPRGPPSMGASPPKNGPSEPFRQGQVPVPVGNPVPDRKQKAEQLLASMTFKMPAHYYLIGSEFCSDRRGQGANLSLPCMLGLLVASRGCTPRTEPLRDEALRDFGGVAFALKTTENHQGDLDKDLGRFVPDGVEYDGLSKIKTFFPLTTPSSVPGGEETVMVCKEVDLSADGGLLQRTLVTVSIVPDLIAVHYKVKGQDNLSGEAEGDSDEGDMQVEDGHPGPSSPSVPAVGDDCHPVGPVGPDLVDPEYTGHLPIGTFSCDDPNAAGQGDRMAGSSPLRHQDSHLPGPGHEGKLVDGAVVDVPSDDEVGDGRTDYSFKGDDGSGAKHGESAQDSPASVNSSRNQDSYPQPLTQGRSTALVVERDVDFPRPQISQAIVDVTRVSTSKMSSSTPSGVSGQVGQTAMASCPKLPACISVSVERSSSFKMAGLASSQPYPVTSTLALSSDKCEPINRVPSHFHRPAQIIESSNTFPAKPCLPGTSLTSPSISNGASIAGNTTSVPAAVSKAVAQLKRAESFNIVSKHGSVTIEKQLSQASGTKSDNLNGAPSAQPLNMLPSTRELRPESPKAVPEREDVVIILSSDDEEEQPQRGPPSKSAPARTADAPERDPRHVEAVAKKKRKFIITPRRPESVRPLKQSQYKQALMFSSPDKRPEKQGRVQGSLSGVDEGRSDGFVAGSPLNEIPPPTLKASQDNAEVDSKEDLVSAGEEDLKFLNVPIGDREEQPSASPPDAKKDRETVDEVQQVSPILICQNILEKTVDKAVEIAVVEERAKTVQRKKAQKTLVKLEVTEEDLKSLIALGYKVK